MRVFHEYVIKIEIFCKYQYRKKYWVFSSKLEISENILV